MFLDIRGEEKDASGSGFFRIQHKVKLKNARVESKSRKTEYLIFLALIQSELETDLNEVKNNIDSSAIRSSVTLNLDPWLAELRLRRKTIKSINKKGEMYQQLNNRNDLIALL